VLLDVSPGDAGEFDRATLERMGHPVLVCHGPSAEASCPLLGGHGCPKFEQAHGIVFKLDLAREQHRAIVRRYRQLARPDVPIRVLVARADAERHAELLQDVELWTHEPNVADLDGFAAEVEAADRLA
jgi:hypothetical protein